MADKYCKICRIVRKKKTVHCKDCNVCVIDYDHHCPWTGKCIGGKNLTFFYVFLGGIFCSFLMGMFAFIGIIN